MKIILLATAIFALTISQSLSQNTLSSGLITRNPPYSLENDLVFESEMISKSRTDILMNTTIESIEQKLRSSEIRERMQAISLLGYIGGDNARIEIEDILSSASSKEIKLTCLNALNLMRDSNSKQTLLMVLNDPTEELRIKAAINLTLIGEKIATFKFFSDYYTSGDHVPYYSCHIGFLYIGSNRVRPFLINDLSNPDIYIAIDAAIILAQIGFGEDAFYFLKKNLGHPDKYIRMASLRGLAYIGDAQSLSLIKTLAKDNEPLVSERVNMIVNKFE